jgi:hypothetical protein
MYDLLMGVQGIQVGRLAHGIALTEVLAGIIDVHRLN